MKNISPLVIYYHSVAPDYFEGWPFKFLTHKLQDFEDQLVYLKKHRIATVFLDRWLAIRRGETMLENKEVCLTLDDGFLDNWVYVFPLVKKYKMRITLFVAPECIDPNEAVRPTLEDVWNGKCQLSDLEGRGFVNWSELKIMHESGLVDIQSHTMSHDKYIASPEISSFYYGGANGVYPIWNAVPGIKLRYMKDDQFTSRLSWGTPLFKEESAATVRKHTINPEFIQEAASLAKKFDLSNLEYRATYEQEIKELHQTYHRKHQLIASIESADDYQKRLEYEVVDSKKIIEEKLQKPVHFLCWPHGDNTQEAHDLAKKTGYLATTSGKMTNEADKNDRIPRIGAVWRHSRWLNKQKIHYKLASHYRQQPFYAIWLANEFKNQMLNKN
ncbi:MAG: hypothetical protein DHS20C18_09160 [Saprospiraceae bacterium]|nr:MAG: hypothetical protein DHS20C18_09160 [Saprospiraceae bacterium]